MKGKLLFVVGLGVGYVLGTRAGRRRYEQIKSAAIKVWDSPAVQKPVHSMQDYAADRIGDLGGAVTESLKRAVTGSGGSNSGASTKARASASGRASGTTTSAKSAGSKSSSAKSSGAKSSTAKKSASGSGSASKAKTSGDGASGTDGQES